MSDEMSASTMTRTQCALALRDIAKIISQFEMNYECDVLERAAKLLESVEREHILYAKAMRGQ